MGNMWEGAGPAALGSCPWRDPASTSLPRQAIPGILCDYGVFTACFFFKSYLKVRETVPGAGWEAALCLHADNLTAPKVCQRQQLPHTQTDRHTARSTSREKGRDAHLGPQEPIQGERAVELGLGEVLQTPTAHVQPRELHKASPRALSSLLLSKEALQEAPPSPELSLAMTRLRRSVAPEQLEPSPSPWYSPCSSSYTQPVSACMQQHLSGPAVALQVPVGGKEKPAQHGQQWGPHRPACVRGRRIVAAPSSWGWETWGLLLPTEGPSFRAGGHAEARGEA